MRRAVTRPVDIEFTGSQEKKTQSYPHGKWWVRKQFSAPYILIKMKENVKKEIAVLKQIVKNWYNFYLSCANGHKYDQIHVEEFEETINIHLSPYLQRLGMCKCLNGKEIGEFYGWLSEMRSDLSKAISEVKPEEKEDPVITLIKNLGLNDTQKKSVAEYLKAEKNCNGNCENCAKNT